MSGTGSDAPAGELLQLEDVTKAYGQLLAVDEVSMGIRRGERRALIGPNGAGKTTLFDLVGGRTPVSGGTIRFEGRDVTRAPEHQRARLGIAKTFQHSNLFDGLSVHENVATAVQRRAGVAHHGLRAASRFRKVDSKTAELLEIVGLADKRRATAGALSHGERRQLEVAVALAIEPSLLLLDEPVAGMSPGESQEFVDTVASLPQALTILVIEHDIDVVFSLASEVTVLHAGRVLAEGRPEDVRASAEVQEAYLGSGRGDQLFSV